MNLNELTSACQLYNSRTNFDISYLDFLNSINNSLAINKHEHRKSLLIWLRRWACRQFIISYDDFASEQILKWYTSLKSLLPNKTKNIWELDDKHFDKIRILYDTLANTQVAKRHNKNNINKKSIVHVGPTGASKILFALRPKSLIPWDSAMRADFEEGDSGLAYIEYIKKANEIIRNLQNQCNKNNFEVNELPEKIKRIYSTIPKLIDEYNWVTITKKWRLPKLEIFR